MCVCAECIIEISIKIHSFAIWCMARLKNVLGVHIKLSRANNRDYLPCPQKNKMGNGCDRHFSQYRVELRLPFVGREKGSIFPGTEKKDQERTHRKWNVPNCYAACVYPEAMATAFE